MPRINAPVYALNGGEVGKDALARFDLERLRYAADLSENVIPEVIGRWRLRPGFQDLEAALENARMIPFIVSSTNKFLLVIDPTGMRILQGDTYVSRAAVSTTIQNGDFSSFTGWSDESTGSATAGVSGGNLVLTGASNSSAIARQQVTVAAADQGDAHGLNVTVARGPVRVRIGTTAGTDDILEPVLLEEGSHSLEFTPTGASFWIDLLTEENRVILVDSAVIAGSGDIVISHPWTADNISSIRYDQSQDVLFVAADGVQQRRIERRGDRSWSVVRYKTENGPFDIEAETSVTIAPSVTNGVGTLTANAPIFSAQDVGSLFRLTHSQQLETATLSAPNQATDSIRISGVGATSRTFTVTITADGSWNGTITLERSIAEPGDWTSILTFNGSVVRSVTDILDNQIVFYRLNVTAHTAGSAAVELRYDGGSTQGVARVVGFTSPTVVDMEVLSSFGSTTATTQWDRGSWSDRNGWPNTVALHDGRLWWGREERLYGSESDRFDGFNDEATGDSAPVLRSIGAGPQRGMVWLESLQRLIAGTDISEVSIRSSSFDEPLTATAFVPRDASTRGCADIAPVQIDTAAIFVQRSLFRIFDLTFSGEASDYISRDLTELHTDICKPGVVSIAVQRQPDTRIWFVLSDGTMRVLTYEPSENVVAWSRIVTDGMVTDVEVLPSTLEDQVHIVVSRNINGSDVRRIERMARSDQAVGGNVSAIADRYVHIQHSTPSATIDGLEQLEGEQVVVWADGRAIHDQSNMATVSGGSITNTTPYTNIVVGLPYTGRWRSTKLAYGAGGGTALGMYKKIDHLGMYLVDTVLNGVRIGRDFSNLTGLSRTDRGQPLDFAAVQSEFDVDLQQLNGGWDVDSRVCIQSQAPYPVSAAALVIAMKTNDR